MGDTWRGRNSNSDKYRSKGKGRTWERNEQPFFEASANPPAHTTTISDIVEINEPQITGKIKFYNSEKGFGFVSRDDGKPDLFFHISKSNCPNPLVGMKVKFSTEDSQRGPRVAKMDLA